MLCQRGGYINPFPGYLLFYLYWRVDTLTLILTYIVWFFDQAFLAPADTKLYLKESSTSDFVLMMVRQTSNESFNRSYNNLLVIQKQPALHDLNP